VNSYTVKSLAIAIVALGFAATSTFGVGTISGSDQGKRRVAASLKPLDQHERLIRTEGTTAHAAESSKRAPGKAWLLEPEVFDRLSAAGRRAALLANGILTPERSAVESVRVGDFFLEAPSLGDNKRVNDPSLDEFGHTNSETSIAVNGQNIAVSFNDAAFFDASGYAYSTDAGATFTHKRIPTPDNGRGDSFGDGVVAYGPNGELYYSTLADDRNGTSFVGVAKSTDNGATFSQVIDASTSANNGTDFQDKRLDGG
jgi:hypothetical protein